MSLAPFVASYASFNFTQNGLVYAADRRAKRHRGLGRVPLENIFKVFWRQVILRFKAAARQQRVRQAHDGGVAELDAYRELIVPLQERSVNDTEYVPAVVQPVFVRKLRSYNFKLLGKAHMWLDAETHLECRGDGSSVFTVHLPRLKRTRIATRSCVRDVENIVQPRRVASVVHKCNALGAAPHIATHAPSPHVIPGASTRIRALGMDKQLVCERIFVVAGHGVNKRCPRLVTVCDAAERIMGKLGDAG